MRAVATPSEATVDNLQPQIEYTFNGALRNTWLGEGGPEGIPSAISEQVAPLYWDLYERRDQAELVFNS